MLYIYVDDCSGNLPKKFISNVTSYFDFEYDESWFSEDFVKRIIRTVDKTEVVGEGKSINLYNEILGNFPPQNLSSGCKGLILLLKDDVAINGNRLGDNCMELLIEIADQKDVTISLGHLPPFPEKFNAVVINTGNKVENRKQFNNEYLDVLYGG